MVKCRPQNIIQLHTNLRVLLHCKDGRNIESPQVSIHMETNMIGDFHSLRERNCIPEHRKPVPFNCALTLLDLFAASNTIDPILLITR